MGARGQTTTLSGLSGNIFSNETYKNWSADYTITNTTVRNFEFTAIPKVPVTINYVVDLTKGTGSHTDCSVVLYGKCFNGDSWETIDSGTTGTITTTYHLELSTSVPKRYRYFKVAFTGTGVGTTTISSQEFKLWFE